MPTRPLITTDCHFAPPPTLADELPETFRSRVPHIEHRDDGAYFVRPGLDIAAMKPDSEETTEGMKARDAMTAMMAQGIKLDLDDGDAVARLVQGNVAPEANPAFTAEGILADLARDGVVGAVLIGANGFGAMDDVEASIAWSELHNDWAADAFKDHLRAFAPSMHLPLLDIAASVKELERAAGMGLRPLLLPDVIPSKPYTLPEWEPLWEAAAGLGVPLATHVGGARSQYPWTAKTAYSPGQGATTAFALVSAGMLETVAWFANGGILERYPTMKVVMTECSAGWLAWAMNFFDHHYFGRFGNGFLTRTGAQPMKATEAPPSYYIKRQIACTFMDDPIAVHNREFTGLDCLMWGNDYPHHEGVFPDSQEWIEKQFAGVDEAEVMHMVHDNAANVYGLTV